MPGERKRCRSCGATVVFLHTLAGKLLPVDSDTVEEGDVDFEPCRHVSHFATCPQMLAWWRRRVLA